jgi:hypothetical protein
MATKHPPDAQPPANLGGRPPALKPEHIAALHDIVTERARLVSKRLPTSCITAAAYTCVQRLSGAHCGHKA